MGFNIPQWKFLNKCFRESGLMIINKKLSFSNERNVEENYFGKKMLELGCQEIRKTVKLRLLGNDVMTNSHFRPLAHGGIIAKSYFDHIGIETTSVDKTACYNSLKLDLRNPIRKDFYNYFDIITNSGTTEHVKPFRCQYETFKNIHLCAKKGGIMLHILPGISKYYGHCQTYYDYEFFKVMAELNDYEIILMEDIKKRKTTLWIGVCFRKNKNNNFNLDKEIFFKHLEWIDKKIHLKHRNKKSKYF